VVADFSNAEKLTVWTPTQSAVLFQKSLAEAFRLLSRGVADRRSPFHTPCLATVGADGIPTGLKDVLIFFASENLSRIKQPGFYHAPRTATLSVSTKPKVFPKIATETIPLEIESLSSPDESASWIDYRIGFGNSLAMLEPPAGARLSAPMATNIGSDPFLAANREQRSPSVLAESAASSSQIVANNVSSIRASDMIESLDNNRWSTDRTTLTNNNAWPTSTRLLGEISRIESKASIAAIPEIRGWVARVSAAYEELTQKSLTDETSTQALESLQELAIEGATIAESIKATDAILASDVVRLSYSIERRCAVWTAVSNCVLMGKTRFIATRKHAMDAESLQQ